jgi:hypothetical protein
MEIWKDIPNYEGHYQVSNFGNVKSIKISNERVLKPGLNSEGYLLVILYKYSIQKTFKIHKLVAMAFLNHTPDKTQRIVVDHINNIKIDNRLENLQLITQRQNATKDKNGYSSRFIGVTWYKKTKKWQVRIYINGKNKNLGYYTNELEAANAYQSILKTI